MNKYKWASNKEIAAAALKYKPLLVSAPKILEALQNDFPGADLPSVKSISSYCKRQDNKKILRQSAKKKSASKSPKSSSTPLGKSESDRNAGMYSYFTL